MIVYLPASEILGAKSQEQPVTVSWDSEQTPCHYHSDLSASIQYRLLTISLRNMPLCLFL